MRTVDASNLLDCAARCARVSVWNMVQVSVAQIRYSGYTDKLPDTQQELSCCCDDMIDGWNIL